MWERVRSAEPQHVGALYSLGVSALRRRDTGRALELLSLARRAAPRDPMIVLTISVVHRDRGDANATWATIMEALALDPYFLPGLLSKAEFLEQHRGRRAAATVFRDVLHVAPVEAAWPATLRRRLEHARDVVARDAEECADFLRQRMAAAREPATLATDGRWDEAASILAGRTRPYRAECNNLHVPRLPAIPFYSTEQFSWVPELEAQTDIICGELLAALASHQDAFAPYIQYRPGDPVNQWQELNHSRQWSSLHLWQHGERVQANVELCPRTVAALEQVGAVQIPGLCPNAMFSALAPRTVIPPHNGETNARLVGHLPLVVPDGCSFRVGYDRLQWQKGKVIVFDDTIEHEARNDSNELRVVLIFDVWNPLISEEERTIVRELASALRDYRAMAQR